MVNILGLSGSLRQSSINTATLHAAAELAGEGVSLSVRRLTEIPLYDGDVEAAGIPDGVIALAAEISAADAVLIASPEYNYSISGVMKNALDWLSRVKDQPVFRNKPVAIVSATAGGMGGPRAQYALRLALTPTGARVLTAPEVLIGPAATAFDDGKLVNEMSRKLLGDLVSALASATN